MNGRATSYCNRHGFAQFVYAHPEQKCMRASDVKPLETAVLQSLKRWGDQTRLSAYLHQRHQRLRESAEVQAAHTPDDDSPGNQRRGAYRRQAATRLALLVEALDPFALAARAIALKQVRTSQPRLFESDAGHEAAAGRFLLSSIGKLKADPELAHYQPASGTRYVTIHANVSRMLFKTLAVTFEPLKRQLEIVEKAAREAMWREGDLLNAAFKDALEALAPTERQLMREAITAQTRASVIRRLRNLTYAKAYADRLKRQRQEHAVSIREKARLKRQAKKAAIAAQLAAGAPARERAQAILKQIASTPLPLLGKTVARLVTQSTHREGTT
jgi:hypothetical protein